MLSNTSFKTGEDFYHRLNFLFNLLVATPLLPFAVLYLLSIKDQIPDVGLSGVVKIVTTIILSIAAVVIATKAVMDYRNQKLQFDPAAPLRKKLIRLHEALIQKFLWLEVASFLSILGLWLSQHKIHIVVFVIILVIFSLKRPAIKMFVEDLKLKENESRILRNKELIE
ncbi:MAG: hypothetical protein O2887_13095 [Bacteroidetes bacterium]|nr:hypothetical protein [Bacteroidota bacterium]MDA1121406.1 hypothetical protein [Bacteroidota bacterium]